MPRPTNHIPLGRRVRDATRNALELVRLGRLGEDYVAPFDVVATGAHHTLRRYACRPMAHAAPVALLVPPLMLTAEIYDLAVDTSAVMALGDAGIRPYVVDFGSPEDEAGGLERSLDDHVRAVAEAIAQVRAREGRDVHLLGYSQGGMFAYQAAAYLRSEGIASVITFGSPVDLHKNLPAVRSDVTGAVVRALEPVLAKAFAPIEGLPGRVTSTGFKILSTRKEVEQRLEFLRVLHDRRALARREARRRFLKGAGFVAWPGPAFRAFVEQFVVHNRMLTGGFVIDGRLASLSDIRCPMLAFYGTSDELARPATVKAVETAAPQADVRFVPVAAGHFGIIVGTRAMSLTWPTVTAFIAAKEGVGPEPEILARAQAKRDDDLEPEDFELELELFIDTAKRTVSSAWRAVGQVVADVADTADAVRYQEPRFRRLAAIEPDVKVSASLELARRARATPDATFFLFGDRAFSYADADGRVSRVAHGFHAAGVRHGDRVLVWMATRPSFLTAVTALGRLSAIAVIAPEDVADGGRQALEAALSRHAVSQIVTDPERAEVAMGLGREVLVLGGGSARAVAAGARDLEAIDPGAVVLHEDVHLDDGRARDIALVMLRRSDDGTIRAAPVTNHRWALSAIGAAAACTVEPADTVYAAVPLHHPTGILVAVGAALVSGARLALPRARRGTSALDPEAFFSDVRRTGATVVFYAGEMLRPLLELPASRKDRALPVRLFAGSGMRKDLAARLRERFGVDVMEFYAGTTHRAIIADPSSPEPGALGHVLPGSADVVVLDVDLATGALRRSEEGVPQRAARGTAGLLAVRLADDELKMTGDAVPPVRVIEGLLEGHDAWLVTSDVVVENEHGVFSFVDALSGFVSTAGGPVSTRTVEDALYAAGDVLLAAAFAVPNGELVAATVTRGALDAAGFDRALTALPASARPRRIFRLERMALTEGFRPDKRAARSAEYLERLVLDASGHYTRG